MKSAGEKIHYARLRAGLTLKQLSEKYEIPLSTLKDWEGGQHKCPSYVLNLLVDRLERDYCPQADQNLYEDPNVKHDEFTPPCGKEDLLFYVKNVIVDLCDSLTYTDNTDDIEVIDEFLKYEFWFIPNEILEIKDYLTQKYGENWSSTNYRDAVISYICNSNKAELLG